MGHNPDREPPFFFFAKPANAVVLNRTTVPYPAVKQAYTHPIEMVVALKEGGYRIPESAALDKIYGYCVGLADMTRRDMRRADLKEMGRPWGNGGGLRPICSNERNPHGGLPLVTFPPGPSH